MRDFIPFVGSIMLVIGIPTVLLDMSMNGSRYAYWAPWGLVMAGLGLILISLHG